MSRNKKLTVLYKLSHIHIIIISRFLPLPIFYYADKTNEASGIKRKLEQKSSVISKLFKKEKGRLDAKKKVGDFTRYIHDHHIM